MDRQLDWHAFFEQTDRQREARRKLIDDLPDNLASERVKRLLHAFDELMQVDPRAERRSDGSVWISAPIATVLWKLGLKSRNTARAYIDEAVATGFLALIDSDHCPHTYSVCWLRILDKDGGQGGEKIPAEAAGQSLETTPGDVRRGSIRRGEGVRTTQRRGSIDRGQGGQIDPGQCPSLKPVSETGFQGLKSKNRFQTGLREGGQIPQRTSHGFFRWWEREVDVRNLANPEHVDELFELAVAAGCFEATRETRLQTFALAVSARRQGNNPKALFRSNVVRGRWFFSCQDMDEAARQIARLEFADPEEPDLEEIDQGPAVPVQTHVDLLEAFAAKRAARAAQ